MCCLDRNSPEYSNSESRTVRFEDEKLQCGDVVVALINDIFWIDFDGESDQPWHRSLKGNAHQGNDLCITQKTKEGVSVCVAPPETCFNDIGPGTSKGGYGHAERLTRLGSDYDISNCNQAEFKGVYHDIAKRWATSLQECHEVIVTQHQSSSDFGNFEDCWDECKSCGWVSLCDGCQESKWECDHNPFLPECKTKCGDHGTCCRHGNNDDPDYNDGLCNENVDVTSKGLTLTGDNAKFSHNMEMGTYNHHGCVPRPRDPKTCKCSVLSTEQRITNYIDSNGLVKACPTCSEGFTLTPTPGVCLKESKCERCPQNSYPKLQGACVLHVVQFK